MSMSRAELAEFKRLQEQVEQLLARVVVLENRPKPGRPKGWQSVVNKLAGNGEET